MQNKRQNISPVKQRILQFVDTLDISKREFYRTINVSRGTLESNTGITEDIVAKFIVVYPQVSIEWLVTGYGRMFNSENEKHNISTEQQAPNSSLRDISDNQGFINIDDADKTFNQIVNDNSKLVEANVKLASANLLLTEANAKLVQQFIDSQG